MDVEDFMDTTMWMKAYVEQHKRHETMRTSWAERQKIASTFGQVMNDSIQPALIAGDSFSAAPSIWPNPWASCWPDALNISERGCSNWAIMNQLDKQPLQPAIINFSHLFSFPIVNIIGKIY